MPSACEDDIPGVAFQEVFEVFGGDGHQAGAGFQGGPGHVGGDEAVPGGKKGVVGVRRFCGQHIQSGPGDDPLVEGFRQVGFVNQGPPACVDEKG